MKFTTTTFVATGLLTSTALAAVSEHGPNHAPAIRRHSKTKKCSSKKHSNKSHSGSGSGSGYGSGSGSDSGSGSSSDSTISLASSGSASGSGKNITLSGKQGLAWPNSNGMDINNFFIGNVDWFYSWGATPGWDAAPTDKLFCPMLWGDNGSGGNADEFNKKVTQDPNGKFNKYKCAFGMNEVNQQGQADMSPSHACSLMKKYIMPLADDGWYIIGPSTTSAPAGLTTWYAQFMTECKDVFDRLDAVAVHYYDVTVSGFQKYVENWHKTTGKDIWITEAACQNFNGGAQCSSSEAWNFLTEMTTWVNQQDYIKGFAPFGVMQNLQGVAEVNRLSQGSNPTSLFKAFAEK